MPKKIYYLIEKPFIIISSLASIISVVLLCFNNLIASFIAVCCLCVALGVFTWALVNAIFKYTKQVNKTDYRRIATFIEYKTNTNNAEIIEFQSYRIVQVKTPILKSIEVIYKWSGNGNSEITSDLQTIENIIRNIETPRGYTKAILTLQQPKLYNETAVFHHKITAHDADHSSDTKVEMKIDEPIDLVRVNISLGYKPDNYRGTARVERSAITHDAPPVYEHVELIPFDPILKEFTYTLKYPDPGYFYKISWDR